MKGWRLESVTEKTELIDFYPYKKFTVVWKNDELGKVITATGGSLRRCRRAAKRLLKETRL